MGRVMKGEAVKKERKDRRERDVEMGEGRWLLVCRGLSVFHEEEKMLERQWLATSLSLWFSFTALVL